MHIFKKDNYLVLAIALFLIFLGFAFMKLETAEYGFGWMALILAPILIILGFVAGTASIFYGTFFRGWLKSQWQIVVSGWILFLISFTVFFMTMEETASLWDCSEFIACAYKLQVPHPPGAPLFLIIGRLFSMLAGNDVTNVAFYVNQVSVVSSAFAIMFTFWVVVMLARKISPESSLFSLILSGVTGSLVIAFADSFWFSAVEAETYALATFFLILCFWAILKWEKANSEQQKTAWMIFIFYMLGLSVGVHPMVLLILPALVIIFIFKYRNFTWKYLFLALTIGASGILFLNHVVLFGLPDMMKYFDIFAVNNLGMPFYSGVVIFIILLITFGYLVYRWSRIREVKLVSISIIGLLYFLIGYSSYFMVIIRSQANPSIDEHNPDNLVSLASYLKRESYGSRPFLYGPDFTSEIRTYKKGAPVYIKGETKYEIIDYKTEYEYVKESQSIFPRMYSTQAQHVSTYREWTGIKTGQNARFLDNMKFMIGYQFGHMYLRYLMFNFAGRSSDIQHATWLSPFDYLEELPAALQQNKARNNFWMLPLLLGFAGMYLQFKKDKSGFWSLMAFFLFFGLILVFYLNSPPNEPRERDYIYVGSFLAFAIWCGIGALGFSEMIQKWSDRKKWIGYFSAFILCVPLIMLVEGYDDHDRSGRTLQVDHARNTLASCAPNAILFTGGDNDTFPLWYVQEVEGFRTDVRVIVLSYFNGDWYIDQMRRKVYNSEALPFSLDQKDYHQGSLNDILPYVENPKINGAIDLKKYLDLIKKEHSALQVRMAGGTTYNSIPSRIFSFDTNRDQVLKSNEIPEKYRGFLTEEMSISWEGNYLEKSALMALDLIATNDWARPVYFNMTSLNTIALDLENHVLQEGLVYRLWPIELPNPNEVDSDRMYSNLMEKWRFRDLKNENVYYNHEDYQLRILQTTKSSYNVLANTLIDEGKRDKAMHVMDFLYENFMHENIELDISSIQTIELLSVLGRHEQVMDLAKRVMDNANEQLAYFADNHQLDARDSHIQLYMLSHLTRIAQKFEYDDLSNQGLEILAQRNMN